MNMLMIMGVIVLFTYFGGNIVPDILVKNKKILLGILLGLVIESSDLIEGNGNPEKGKCREWKNAQGHSGEVCLTNIKIFMDSYKKSIHDYLLQNNPTCEDFINNNLVAGYIARPPDQDQFFDDIRNAIKTDDPNNENPGVLGSEGQQTVSDWVTNSTSNGNRNSTSMGYGFKTQPNSDSPLMNGPNSPDQNSKFKHGIVTYNHIEKQQQNCDGWMLWGVDCLPSASANNSDYGSGMYRYNPLYSADEGCSSQ